MSATNGTASSAATLELPEAPAPEAEESHATGIYSFCELSADAYTEACANLPDDWLTAPDERLTLRGIPGISSPMADRLAARKVTFLDHYDDVMNLGATLEGMDFSPADAAQIHAAVAEFRRRRQPVIEPMEDAPAESNGAEPATEPVEGSGEHDGGICHDAGAALADAGAAAEVLPKKPESISLEEELDCRRRHDMICRSLYAEVARANAVVGQLSEQLKEAKKRLEARQDALNQKVNSDPLKPTQAKMFVAEGEETAKAVAEVTGEKVVAAITEGATPMEQKEAAATSPDDLSWRSERFDGPFFTSRIPDGVKVSLAEAEIYTLGDLVDRQAKHGDFWCKDIKGVGSGKRKKIEDACIEFHAERAKNSAAAG